MASFCISGILELSVICATKEQAVSSRLPSHQRLEGGRASDQHTDINAPMTHMALDRSTPYSSDGRVRASA